LRVSWWVKGEDGGGWGRWFMVVDDDGGKFIVDGVSATFVQDLLDLQDSVIMGD